MNTGDPFLQAAWETYQTAFDEMNACLKSLSTSGLNWKPEGDDFNSIAVLAVHSLGSTRSWLCVAAGAELPPRDRDLEFRAEAATAAEFRDFCVRLQAGCMDLLSRPPRQAWQDLRRTHARPDPEAAEEVTGAWALLHALEHLREHLGQMLLTRQLWENSDEHRLRPLER